MKEGQEKVAIPSFPGLSLGVAPSALRLWEARTPLEAELPFSSLKKESRAQSKQHPVKMASFLPEKGNVANEFTQFQILSYQGDFSLFVKVSYIYQCINMY